MDLDYYKPTSILLDVISKVQMNYHSYLKKKNMICLGDTLLYFKAIDMNRKVLSLIIVPDSLRCSFFDHYHGDPSSGHLGVYKTFY